jgi:4-amino-4-deoxy-L-arabinose transferase-like glycosyltransferase
VQLLNVPAVVGAVLLAIAVARLVWPERPWLGAYAAGFVALDPVLARVGAMVNPEPADLLVSMLCLYLAARILLGRGPRLRTGLWLGVALGCGEMIRQFALWTLAVVVLAFLAAGWRRRVTLLPLGVALAACVAIALPWYVYRAQHYGNPVFDRPQSAKPLWERRPASFYVDPGLPDVFTRPYRPHMVNLVWPETYSDIWGDWYGVFAWSSAHARPSRAANAWLVFQNVLGLLPTALAIGGWLALLGRSLRRRDGPRLLVALLPLAGIAGFLYFTVSFPTRDGDVIKPMYMLTTLGAWALCFGWAADRLPRLRWALFALALLDVPFVVYKGAVGFF